MTLILPAAERQAATLWLKAAAAPSSAEMVAAVGAWIYRESGPTILRNNPLNLHSSGGLAGQIGSVDVSAADPNVAVFSSLQAGVAAAVRNLVRPWPGGAAEAVDYGYVAVLSRARAGDAMGFLAALAASSWSAGRYGTRNGGANDLVPLYRAIIGPAPVPAPVPAPTPGGTPPVAPTMDELAAGIGTDLDYIANKLNAGDTGLAAFESYLRNIRLATAQIVALVGGSSSSSSPADPAPAAPAFMLTPVTRPTWPVNQPATVLPELGAAFTAHNPALDPALAARIAQALGQAGFSAQALLAELDVRASDKVPGLIVTGSAWLPLYETGEIPDGTVLADAGLGTNGLGL